MPQVCEVVWYLCGLWERGEREGYWPTAKVASHPPCVLVTRRKVYGLWRDGLRSVFGGEHVICLMF